MQSFNRRYYCGLQDKFNPMKAAGHVIYKCSATLVPSCVCLEKYLFYLCYDIMEFCLYDWTTFLIHS